MTAETVLAMPVGQARDDAIHEWCKQVWAAFSANRSMVASLLAEMQDCLTLSASFLATPRSGAPTQSQAAADLPESHTPTRATSRMTLWPAPVGDESLPKAT